MVASFLRGYGKTRSRVEDIMFGISKSLLNTKSITRCPNEEDSPFEAQKVG